jgi:hypothetical protein
VAGDPGGTPFLDADGNLTPVWHQFLISLWRRTGAGPGQNTVTGVVGASGAVTLANLVAGGVAPLANPALQGVPTAPLAAPGTTTTQIATTAFVGASQAAAGSSLAGLNSPIFTGIPQAPTALPGTINSQLATTQFVATAFGSGLSSEGIGVGASPFSYSPPASGSVLVSGGTVTGMTLRRGLGLTYPVGVIAGSIRVSQYDTLTVTYTPLLPPAMVFFPS